MMGVSDGRWHPGIGDPSLAGWVTVAAYGLAMLVCYLSHRYSAAKSERNFWLVIAVVMALLGVNKQLDLQSWLTELGRDMALANGWYNERRFVQVMFISWLTIIALGVAVWLGHRLGEFSKHAKLAGLGLVLLAFFVVMRASSMHHVDALLSLSFVNLRLNVALELMGIAMIVWAGVRHLLECGLGTCWKSYKLQTTAWAKQRERSHHVNNH